MAKMGRPKSDVIKDKIVTIRMSAEEHQKLRDYSEKLSLIHISEPTRH